MTNHMINYISNFVKNGDPNIGTNVRVQFPRFSNELKNLEITTNRIYVRDALKKKVCDFWDSMGYKWGWTTKFFKALDPRIIENPKIMQELDPNKI